MLLLLLLFDDANSNDGVCVDGGRVGVPGVVGDDVIVVVVGSW